MIRSIFVWGVLLASIIVNQCDAQVYYRAAPAYRVYRPSYATQTHAAHPYASTTYRNTAGRLVYPTSRRQSYSQPRASSYSHPSRSRSKTAAYRLDAGDVVAVIVQGVTGDFSKAPVHMPKDGDDTLPAVGHPMVVLPDGTLPMPLIKSVNVRGMTVTQARDAISRAYLDEEILNKPNQVTLSLMRKRTISVSVLHDNPSLALRGISNVKIPADRANVLNALAGSGTFDRDAQISVIKSVGQRTSSGSPLSNGDVVQLRSPSAGVFFTGGNLRGGQYALPTHQPVNVLQAIAMAGGVQSQSIIGPREVIVVRRNGGSMRFGYAQILNNPNATMMMPGDTLIVR